MLFLRSQLRLCYIVDADLVTSGRLVEHCQELFNAGVTSLFFRLAGKSIPAPAQADLTALVALTRKLGRYCFMIDDTVAAVAQNCHGVFFSRKPPNAARVREVIGTDRFLGCNVSNFDDVSQISTCEFEEFFDFYGIGPVIQFGEKSHRPIGLAAAKRITEKLRQRPVFWMGGIQPEGISEFETGFADGIAVARSLNSENVQGEAQRLHRLLARRLGPCVWSVGHPPADVTFKYSALKPEELASPEIPVAPLLRYI